MNSTARFPSKKAKSYRERIPLEEMQRLMCVYGSTKCLRKRALGGGTDTKAESIKRKFCRWFPDLDERFEKVEGTGRYVPKAGHEAEVRYREEMRAKDRDVLTKKRMRKRAETMKKESSSCVKKIMERDRERMAEEMKKEISSYTKEKNGEMAMKSSEANAKRKAAPFFPTTVSPNNSKLTFSSFDADEEERKALVSTIQMKAGPSLETGAMEEEPLEDSFIAGGRKVDDVEESFFRPSPSPGDAAARQYRAPLLPGKGTGIERLNLLVRIMGDGPHGLQRHCGHNDGGDRRKAASPPPFPAGQRTANGASLFSQT